MVDFNPVLWGIVAVLLGFIFFVYLFIRRIVTSFFEGMRGGK
ncbi:DUF7859 family protein [Halococcoides cellulosivorans]|nr:hypothetical protein [Halococcoides cellulosivorans]